MLSDRSSRIFGGTMLIAGTSIGAAMLAMPIASGLFGFFGTLVVLIACWAFMYWTAMLIVEASLRFKDGESFLTMAQKTLGGFGALITWVFFLLLFYSLQAAYLSGSGRIMIDALEGFLRIELPPFFDILPLMVIFAPFMYFGISVVDRLNRYLMIGMIMTYLIIIFWLLPNVDIKLLGFTDWSFCLLSFSVVVTSFGYQVIIPTLVSYLDRHIPSIKKCLFYGSLIPLIVYLFWNLVMLGSLSVHGQDGLANAFKMDVPISRLLRIQTNNDFIAALSRGFSIFAIVTSFLGVSQGTFDFLKDWLKAKGSRKKTLIAFMLTFLPPAFLIMLLENSFMRLLEYAGALASIILGIIPILIVWKLRKKKDVYVEYRAPGNKISLIGGAIFFSLVVLLVLLKNLDIIHFDVDSLIK